MTNDKKNDAFVALTNALDTFAKTNDATYHLVLRFKDNGIIAIRKGEVTTRGLPVRRDT